MKTREQTDTLIELLVVIATISIWGAMLLPALSKAREKDREKDRAICCVSNYKQLGLAANMYHSDNNEVYPNLFWDNGWAPKSGSCR